MARLQIGWENKGEKAVGPTTMEVLVPGSIPEFGWTEKWRGAIRSGTAATSLPLPCYKAGGRDAGSVRETSCVNPRAG